MKAEWNILLSQWQDGARSREAALRLLFLSWYSCSEPTILSGLDGVEPHKEFIDEVFEFLGGENADDVEILFVVAVMAEVAAWCLGDEHRWERVAINFRSRLNGSVPAPDIFAERGTYGEYFAHHARVQSNAAT